MTNNIDADIRFSIIPEWILDSSLSDKAIRIYGILARYADNETLQAFPSRETLAQRARCHVKSVDRAVRELIEAGAVFKSQRKNGGEWQSNVYTLRRIPAKGGRDTSVATLGTPMSPPRDTDVSLTRTTELEPENYINAFDEFWEAYPKKTDKGLARKSFKAALKKTDALTIIAAAMSYRDDPNRKPEFTKNPSTWLNAEAWENEALPSTEPVATKPAARVPGHRDWVEVEHNAGEHWACRGGEFGHPVGWRYEPK